MRWPTIPPPIALDRYDVLIALIDAHRWAAQWPQLIETVEQAIDVADELGDVRLLAQAATAANHRRALAVGPAGTGPRRRRGRAAAQPGMAYPPPTIRSAAG